MSSSQVRRYGSIIGLVAGGVVAGGVLAGTLTAGAADTPTAPSTAATQGETPTNPNPGDPSKPQRADETLLTGSTAAKVKAAVLAKYPAAKFIRVETDSDGVYEAHITKADGTETIVQLNKTFTVTGEDQRGGGHHRDHDGDGPDATSSST
jgi:hypothetical protein